MTFDTVVYGQLKMEIANDLLDCQACFGAG